MSSIPRLTAAQQLDLESCNLPQIATPSPGLRIFGTLLAQLRHLFRRDEPGSAVLRDLGIDQERTRCAFHFADIDRGLESSRMRCLDASQGWRGS